MDVNGTKPTPLFFPKGHHCVVCKCSWQSWYCVPWCAILPSWHHRIRVMICSARPSFVLSVSGFLCQCDLTRRRCFDVIKDECEQFLSVAQIHPKELDITVIIFMGLYGASLWPFDFCAKRAACFVCPSECPGPRQQEGWWLERHPWEAPWKGRRAQRPRDTWVQGSHYLLRRCLGWDCSLEDLTLRWRSTCVWWEAMKIWDPQIPTRMHYKFIDVCDWLCLNSVDYSRVC